MVKISPKKKKQKRKLTNYLKIKNAKEILIYKSKKKPFTKTLNFRNQIFTDNIIDHLLNFKLMKNYNEASFKFATWPKEVVSKNEENAEYEPYLLSSRAERMFGETHYQLYIY